MPDKNAAAHRAMAISRIVESVGYVPVVIGMDKNIDNDDIIKTKKEFFKTSVFEMHYPSNSIEWLKMLFDSKQVIRVIEYLGISNIQAIILMDYFSPALYFLMKYCKKHNIRLILDTVDWFSKSSYPFPKNLIKNFDTFIRMHFLNKKTDYLITISSFLEDYYKKHVDQLFRIPGIYYSSCSTKQIKYIPGNVKLISFVGDPGKKCQKEKIDWVIKAVCKINKKAKKIKFVVAGIDKETLRKNRPDLFLLENFDDSVEIIGRISHNDCSELLIRSDFSVVIREDTLLSNAGFPTKIGEAYANGTPVLTTPTSDISDYVYDGYGFVAKDCSYEAVEQMLIKISDLQQDEILSMHNIVIKDNPLDYRKYIKIFQKIIQ